MIEEDIKSIKNELEDIRFFLNILVAQKQPVDRQDKEKRIKDTIQEEVDNELKDLGLSS